MQRVSVRKGGLVLRQEQTVATAERASSCYRSWHSHYHSPAMKWSSPPFSLHSVSRCCMPNALPNSGYISIVEHEMLDGKCPCSEATRCFLKWSFCGCLTCGRHIWIEITHFFNQWIYLLSPLFLIGLMLIRLNFALSSHCKQTSNHLNNVYQRNHTLNHFGATLWLFSPACSRRQV